MAGPNDFLESYYEHNCAEPVNEDVLQSDIPGHTFIVKLKRRWFDWFLVSYSDERARVYLGSSYAMRLERFKHYRNYRNRIHPLSKFRNVHDVFMFVVFLINTVIFHHNTSMTFGELFGCFYYFGALMELIILADVVVNCMTGYIDTETRKIVLGRRLGLLHYSSTKLFVHVASALPLQCILLLRYGANAQCTLCKMNHFVTILKCLSIFGLFRIYEYSSFLTWERRNFVVTHVLKFLRIYLIGMMVLLYYTDMKDTLILMYMINHGEIIHTASVSYLIWMKFVVPNPPSQHTFFIYTFARITKSILLYQTHPNVNYPLDLIASIIGYAIANLVYLWQLLECYNFLSRLFFLDDTVIKTKQSLSNLVRYRQLPDSVGKKLDSYCDYNQSKVRVMQNANLFLKTLPDILKNEALLTRHSRLFKRITCFSEWPFEVIEGAVLMLKEEIYLTNDLVAEPWVQSEGLFIVGMGELAVYNGETETGHLIDGDYFGQLSLVTDKEQRTSRVVAITPCVMLLLEKYAFRGYMRKYPELFIAMKKEILNDLELE